MITLKLTGSEWYFLVCQLQKVVEEHKYNHVPKRILENLMDNKPQIENTVDLIGFRREYECKWEGINKGTVLLVDNDVELPFDLSRMIKKD